MATKTKVTKESAPKVAKASTPLLAPEKKGVAKADKAVVSPEESAPVVASESAQGASKTLAVAVEPKQETGSVLDENTVGSSVSKVKTGEIQDKKWLEIKAILENLKEDTLREIRKSVKKGTEAVAAIEPGGDIYDQASSERDRELGLLLGDREREKIHSIDEALLRIDEGEYGICEECDEDIPLGRLKAMPFTRHCVKCKSDLEKLQAQTKRVEEERAYREIPLGAEDEES